MVRFAAFLAAFILSFAMPASAQSRLVSQDGLNVSFLPGTNCNGGGGSRNLRVLIEAEEPQLFFDVERLSNTVAATRIALSLECERVSHIYFIAEHNGHALGEFRTNPPEHKIFFQSWATDPIWTAVFANAPGAAQQSSVPQRGFQAQPSTTPIEDRRFFYKTLLPYYMRFGARHSFFSIGGTGLYATTPSEFLVGQRYLVYPFGMDIEREGVFDIPGSSDFAEFALHIQSDGVSVSSPEGERFSPFELWDPRGEPTTRSIPECFRSDLLPDGHAEVFPDGMCFTIMKSERQGNQTYFLAALQTTNDMVADKSGASLMKLESKYNFAIFARLLPVDSDAQMTAALASTTTNAAQLQAADQQAVEQGTAKPTLRMAYASAQQRPLFQGLYDNPPTPNIASVEDIDLNERHRFLMYHQIYDRSCPQKDQETRRFAKTSYRYAGEDTLGDTTTVYYEEYIAVDTDVRLYAYDRFADIGERFIGDYTARTMEDLSYGDLDLPSALEVRRRQAEDWGQTMQLIVDNEGCNSPTLRRLERGIDARVGVVR